MSQFGQAAGLIQQNKQAELGRAEDRRRDNQSMMATLLTLFMQGKISREEMDARLQMARENNASAERINAATLQTNRDMAAQSAQLTREGMQQHKEQVDAEFKFKQGLIQTLMVDKMSAAMKQATDNLPDLSMETALANVNAVQDEVTKNAAALEFAVSAMKAKGALKDAGEEAVKTRVEVGKQHERNIMLDVAASQGGVAGVKAATDAGVDLGSPQGAGILLDSSGLAQSKAAPQVSQAMAILQRMDPNKPNDDDTAALRKILVGDGTPSNKGLPKEVVSSMTSMLHSGGLAALEEAKRIADLAANGAIEPEVADAQIQNLRAQGGKLLGFSASLKVLEPVHANFFQYTAAKNKWYDEYVKGVTPGKVLNPEVVQRAISTYVNGPGFTDDDRREMAQGLSALEEQSYGYGRTVEDWDRILNKAKRAGDQAAASPEVKYQADLAGQDELRKGLATLTTDLNRKAVVSKYLRLKAAFQQAVPQISLMPPDQQKQMSEMWGQQISAVQQEMNANGIVMRDYLGKSNVALTKLELDANAAAAKERTINAERLRAARSAVGSIPGMLPPAPSPGLPQAATQLPQQAPATARPIVSPGVQQLRAQINAQRHPMPTVDMPVLPGYALPGEQDDVSIGEAMLNNPGMHDMGSMK